MKKLVKATGACLALITCLSPMAVFAEFDTTTSVDSVTGATYEVVSNDSNFTGAMVNDPSLTAAENEKWEIAAAAKDQQLESSENSQAQTLSAGNVYTIRVTNYQQEDGSWCGPAAA